MKHAEASSDKLQTILAYHDWDEVANVLPLLDPAVAADFFLEIPQEQQQKLFGLLSIETASQLVSSLPNHDAYVLLQSRSNEDLTAIVAALTPAETFRLLEEWPEDLLRNLAKRSAPAKPSRGGESVVPAAAIAPDPIIEARAVEKAFVTPEGSVVQVIAPTSLCVEPGMITALLGPSGSGKSTLLRMLSGLAVPTSGQVLWHGKPISETAPSIAIVFQSFALFPWLTVVENVEVPLLAKGIEKEARRQKALETLESVGLKGFGNAYPKELSGGMKQRVGFARALAVGPELLFMDEPFSALDVLTAENLRGELMELWIGKKIPTKSIFIVTHNIEEAVSLADRVIVLGRNPGRIRADFRVSLQHPRARTSAEFVVYVDYIYKLLTKPDLQARPFFHIDQQPKVYQMLPHARRGAIAGLLELLNSRGGKDDLYQVAEELRMEADALLPIIEAAALLGFAHSHRGDLEITPQGKEFADADIDLRQTLFRNAGISHVTLLQQIHAALSSKPDHIMTLEFFRDRLREYFSEGEVARQIETALNWGRYAGLFTYDSESDQLQLRNVESPVAATLAS